MSRRADLPSLTARAAYELVKQLQGEVSFLRSEVRASRRLALASFGVAMAALGVLTTFFFAH